MSRVPLRLRITLWVVAISGAVQITLSLLIVLYHRENVQTTNQQRLTEAAVSIAAQAEINPATDEEASLAELIDDQIQLRWFGRVAAIDVSSSNGTRIDGPFDSDDFDVLRSATFDGDFGQPGQRDSGQALSLIHS